MIYSGKGRIKNNREPSSNDAAEEEKKKEKSNRDTQDVLLMAVYTQESKCVRG